MAILELVVTGSYLNQLIVNRFHYLGSGTPAAVTPAFGLIGATGFLDVTGSPLSFNTGTLAKAWQSAVHGSYKFVSAYARNLYSTTDFYERPYPTNPAGGLGGDQCSPVLAFGLYGSRARTDIRRAQKRFVGVPEDTVSDGGVITAGHIAVLTTLAGKMDDTLTYDDEGNTLTYAPIVLGLEEYTTPAGNRAYRPYSTEVSQLLHVAQGFTYAPYTTVRTQVSRQYGRGA